MSSPFREVRLYDPARRPALWSELMKPDEYAVFLTEVHSRASLRGDGSAAQARLETCLLFASLEEAAAFCERTVAEKRRVLCEIFDHEGLAKPPLRTFLHPSAESRTPGTPGYRRTRRRLATAFVATALAIALADWRFNLSNVGYLLAAQFATTAFILMVWNLAEKMGSRSRTAEGSERR